MTARGTGDRFEQIALDHLIRAGLTLVTRNFACRYGEIDLVMRDRDTVVFVEVRYRRTTPARAAGFGGGAESVTAGKRARLVRAASVYLAAHPQLAARPCRFDVLAVSGSVEAPTLDWLRNAFEA